jgi:threonylcarbamoyladenosine tRNA methylthiotransferase MtaB
MPDAAIGADVMVGFPGETDAEFDETVRFVAALPFTYLHVFTYSPRPGTAATRLPDAVLLSAAQSRSAHLRHLGQAKGNTYKRRRDGQPADAIVITSGTEPDAMTEDYLTLPVRGARRPRGERFSASIRIEDDALVLY